MIDVHFRSTYIFAFVGKCISFVLKLFPTKKCNFFVLGFFDYISPEKKLVCLRERDAHLL